MVVVALAGLLVWATWPAAGQVTIDTCSPNGLFRLGGASAISFTRYSATLVAAAAAPGARCELRGHRQRAALKDQRYRPVDLTRAESSCARGAPTQRRRSAAARPTFRWSAERPAIRPTHSRRLGGASAISFLGRTMELGRSRRTLMMSVAAGRAARCSEPRGHGKQAALKDQRYRAPLTLLAPNPRARGARRPSDVGQQQRDPHSGGQQSDPRSGRPTRAGWAALRQFRFWGERWSSGVRGER